MSSETRYTEASGSRGMVATAHYLATQAGVWMLQRGGNAVDAAVCAAATIAVVCPNLNGVGGDVFAQVWLPDEDLPVGLNASGRSGSLATADFIRSKGHATMPVRGPLSINVPGAASAWQALLQRFGTRRLYDVLEPAITSAEGGAPVTAGIAAALRASHEFLVKDAGFRDVYWRGGRLLQEGEVFVNPDLGKTLRELGRTDGESIYRGETARLLADGFDEVGSHITAADLASHVAEWVEPVSTSFSNWGIFELPPNSQGIAALEMLNMCEVAGVSDLDPNSAAYVDLLCSVIELAIEDRDRYITDPAFVSSPVEKLISKHYARERLAERAGAPKDASDADTIYLCTADHDGMGVSLIQSQFRGFGSGFTAPGTGIHLNNRGSYFSLDPTHVNRIEPRKRTMHTLMPAMAGGPKGRLVFGTMGGDAQPQIHLQLLMNRLVIGMGLQESIECPRFVWAPLDGNSKRVLLEARFPNQVINELTGLGYEVVIVEEWSSQMGHAQAIDIRSSGDLVAGAADPRGDGSAIGI